MNPEIAITKHKYLDQLYGSSYRVVYVHCTVWSKNKTGDVGLPPLPLSLLLLTLMLTSSMLWNSLLGLYSPDR